MYYSYKGHVFHREIHALYNMCMESSNIEPVSGKGDFQRISTTNISIRCTRLHQHLSFI